jgi:hypothetical protein
MLNARRNHAFRKLSAIADSHLTNGKLRRGKRERQPGPD